MNTKPSTKKEKRLPAIPPNDYKGSIADWQVWLIQNGYIKDGRDTFYGDIYLPESEYLRLLTDCEKSL